MSIDTSHAHLDSQHHPSGWVHSLSSCLCDETLLTVLCRVFTGVRRCSGTTCAHLLTWCFSSCCHASVAFVFLTVPLSLQSACFICKMCRTCMHSYPECDTHLLPFSITPPLTKSTACRRSWVARAVTPLVCRRLEFPL